MTWHIYNAVPTGKFTKSGKPIKRWPDKPTYELDDVRGGVIKIVEREAKEHGAAKAVLGDEEEIVVMRVYSAKMVKL